MAKLSVVYPNVEVEVNGQKYHKVDRSAKAGDIVKITDDGAPSCVVEGAFYQVKRIDSCGDPYIVDEDGDDYDLCNMDFEVYEKVSPEYREVKREAAVGERIKIVKAGYAGDPPTYKNGESFTVTSLYGSLGVRIDRKWLDSDDTDAWVEHDEYVVLEPVNVAEPAPQTKRLTVGDYAKVIANNCSHSYVIGSVVKITKDDADHQPYKAERADGTIGNWMREDDVEPATVAEFNAQKPQPERLKIGEYARVIEPNDNYNDYEIGTIVKLTRYEDRGSRHLFKAEKPDGTTGNWLRDYQLVRATESEVEAAKKAAEREKKIGEFADGGYAVIASPSESNANYSAIESTGAYVKVSVTDGYRKLALHNDKGELVGYCNADALRKVTREEYEEATKPKPVFNVGDKVRLISGGGTIGYLNGYKSGEVYAVSPVNRRKDEGLICIEGGSISKGYAKPEQLEKISEEEAKWKAIGRKVNEFKRGDIVKCTGTAAQQAGLGEVVDILRSNSRVRVNYFGRFGTCTETFDIIALVTPVEQRFDRAEGGASTSK